MLNIRSLSLSTRLNGLSCDIQHKGITLILGKSGSGKSTLLRCLSQLEKEYEGHIFYKGQDLSKMPSKERAELLGFVSQSYALFPHKNVIENCAVPLRLCGYSKRDSYEKAEEALCNLDMGSFLKTRSGSLSGGQQQRVALARALVLDPQFLLLDEPTSALDPLNRELFQGIVQKLVCEGRGVVISTHDMELVRNLPGEILFLEEGRLTNNTNIFNMANI